MQIRNKSKRYKVKEMFYTLQGEGFHVGKPAVFLRFTGCNLWTGLEKDRQKAICRFCDTDFFGMDGENGGAYTLEEVISKIKDLWFGDQEEILVVATGGEPLLQIDAAMIQAFHDQKLYLAVETNGTILPPDGIDWICVSPKSTAPLALTTGNEMKLVYPQHDCHPEQFENLEFEHFYLQPLEDEAWDEHIFASIAYCKSHPQWRLSIQAHKYLGIS